MAKYKISKPCFFGDMLHEAGSIVDFGDAPPPRKSTEVPSLLKQAAKITDKKVEEVAEEDKVLKGAVK
jgi:hypothetical protein